MDFSHSSHSSDRHLLWFPVLAFPLSGTSTENSTLWRPVTASLRAEVSGSFISHCVISIPAFFVWKSSEVKGKVAQSCLTLCDPLDCSLPVSSVHGILQARTLEWVAVPFSRGSSQPRDRTQISRVAGGFFTAERILYQLSYEGSPLSLFDCSFRHLCPLFLFCALVTIRSGTWPLTGETWTPVASASACRCHPRCQPSNRASETGEEAEVSHRPSVKLSGGFIHFSVVWPVSFSFSFPFYWSRVGLQCCVHCFCMATWLSYTYTYTCFSSFF